MTFKDLQKLTSPFSSLNTTLDQLKGLPFWIWPKEEHKREYEKTKGLCCFQHRIGLPTKNGKFFPLFDYEQTIFQALQDHKHIWILKATGLGITEFFLRYMAWLCLYDDRYKGSQMCIVVGPNSSLAVGLIRRLKKLFQPLGVYFDSKETVIELNGCRIESFPSHNLASFRSLPNVSFILLDEGDFFPLSQSQEVRDTSERYIAKSNPYIVLVSTANQPHGLMQSIEQQEPCLYHKIKLDYKVGLDKIYTRQEIEKAKQSPSFEREYNLKYLGMVGNVFSQVDIDKAIEKSKEFVNRPLNNYALHPCGVDWGFGSSKTVACLGEFDAEKETIRVIRVKEFTHATPSQVADELFSWTYDISNISFFCDGSNRGSINELKRMFDEDLEWESGTTLDPYHNKVLPVNFNKEHKQLLFHAYNLVSKGYVSISDKFDKLILSLKTAQATDFSLDKNTSIENDYLDAFRLMLKGIIIEVDS